MTKLVVHGAMLQCNQGTTPATLVVPPSMKADAGHAGLATVMHHQPVQHIGSFGMCRSLANPAVQTATSAAMGVLTPMPCLPNTSAPWTPGSSRGDIAGEALLTDNSSCVCQWGGKIDIAEPGTTAETGA